jgi:DNA polymerase III epsilon subunit-like protein
MTTTLDLVRAVRRNNWIVLDTETTGLDRPAEICQLSLVDSKGTILLDTLLRPMGSISPGAYRVHGITDLHVKDAPSWPTVRSDMLRIIKDRDVIIYNAVFDRKMMHWTDEAWAINHFEYKEWASFYCAMEAYAEFWGEINTYYGSYRWQKLTSAMEQQGLMVAGEHSAVGDAMMTVDLVRVLADRWEEKHNGAEPEDTE